MSAEDLWQLKIPIRLTLAQDEISSPGDVKPVYLLAPRFAYLPALAQQCWSFFQHVLLQMPGQDQAKATKPSAWFEYEGLALNWTQPLGVLHDLLTPQQSKQWPSQQQQQQQQDCGAFSTSAVPWSLTLHFRSQPASLANSWQNSGTAQDHYMTSLKEAGYCCRGTDGCNAVMRLTVQDELWAAVNRGDGAVVRQHLTPLRLIPTERQGSKVPTVPVRLFIRQHKPGSTAGLMGVWAEVYSTTRALEVQQADGSPTLLAHLAHHVMPQRFPAPQRQAAAAAAAAGGGGASGQQQSQPQAAAGAGIEDSSQGQHQATSEAAGDPLGTLGGGSSTGHAATASSSIGSQVAQQTAVVGDTAQGAAAGCGVLTPQWPAAAAVYVCGVQPDWRTPLGWLHANFKAADGFLYVVVHLAL